jgi:dTDP-4-amino-4,6-dideoxygalactose transaminase
MVPTVIRKWLKERARRTGISRDVRMPMLSEEEFRSLEKLVLFPADGADAVARFTAEFVKYLGVRHGVAVNSGTSALEIAVAAAGVGPGDEVIVPSYSFYSTASAVLKARARPVFVDVRLDNGCIDPEEVRKAATPRTKAVIAVHLAGKPADLDALLEICRGRRLTLIEDVAQAVGSEWRGRKLGSFGAIGCFSFQASKNLAAGEGGFIATDDHRLFSVCSSLSNVGLCPDADDWEHVLLGGNYRLPQFEAAILSILLRKVDDAIARREENAAFLTESLSGVAGIALPRRPAEATRINYHFYGFRYDKTRFGGIPKAKFIALLQEQGLPCEGGYPAPLYAHPAFSRNLEVFSKCFASCESAAALRLGPSHHPNTLKRCEEIVGFEQDFLLGGRSDMEGAVQTIRNLSARYNGR